MTMQPISAETLAALAVMQNMSEQDMEIILHAWPQKDLDHLRDALHELVNLIEANSSKGFPSVVATYAMMPRSDRSVFMTALSPSERMHMLSMLDELATLTNAVDMGRVVRETHEDALKGHE